MKNFLRILYYFFIPRLVYCLQLLFEKKIKDIKQIPIVINNRNRISFLLKLIESLEKRGVKNIYIIDNNSSYPPLLKYYDECPYHVFRLKKNIGHLSIWKTRIYWQFIRSYYVYTDSDLVMIDECPDDFLLIFFNQLKKYKLARKVGFSLKIDDLPDCYAGKDKVLEWEKRYWTNEVKDGFTAANIDTTFALYRPFAIGGASYCLSFRSSYPYMVKHLPWYNDSNNLSTEEKYYIEHASSSASWVHKKKEDT